jgi:hypothetical protein
MNNCSRNQAAMPRIASDAERKNRRRNHETFYSKYRGGAFGFAAGGADDKYDNVNRPAEHNVDHDQDDEPCSFDEHSPAASRDEASSPRHALWLPGAAREASRQEEDDDDHHHQELG